ncbi:MAG: hypothetical protein FJ276_31155 [Planctomycetes bacterium]|nr:hypothetical protein [Planctomycetota bacterium]
MVRPRWIQRPCGPCAHVPRMLLTGMLVASLASCGPDAARQEAAIRHQADTRVPPGLPGEPAEREADRGLLTPEQIRDIRRAVESAGGTIQCDAEGQPRIVDLAVGRGSADSTAIRAAVSCRRLVVLRLRAEKLTREELSAIRSLGTLEELMLHDAAIDDDLLAELSGSLTRLKRLTLRNTPNVTDRGAASLAQARQLTHLALIELRVTGESLRALASLPSLVSLDVRMCSGIRGSDLALLRDAPNLGELKLGGYAIDDAAVRVVADLPHLQELVVEDGAISSVGLADLAASTEFAGRVRSLHFARCAGLTDDALALVSAFPNLRELSLRDIPTVGTFLDKLPKPGRLELLALSRTFLTEDAFASIAAFTYLKRLELARVPLTRQSLEHVSRLAHLEYLDVSECGLNDQALQPLAALDKLKRVILDGNPEISAQVLERWTGKQHP